MCCYKMGWYKKGCVVIINDIKRNDIRMNDIRRNDIRMDDIRKDLLLQ